MRRMFFNIKRYLWGAVGLMAVLMILTLLVPVTSGEVNASCLDEPGAAGCITNKTISELSLTAQTAISVGLDSHIKMEITPNSTGATSYSTTKLSVATNNADGYGLFLATSSSDGNLISTSGNNDDAIKNTSLSNVELGKLEKNSYGYAIEETPADENTLYSHLPTSETMIKSTNRVTGSGDGYAYGDTYYLSFGTKIGTDIPAGTYAGSITVSAVANPKTVADISDLYYMQDMTTDICTNTREHYTKQLIDSRDGKSYWVAKLKDGNCWMTQNLAYTITQEMIDNNEINSTNTDLHPNNPSLTGAGQLYTDKTTGITYWNNNEAVTYKPMVTETQTIGRGADNTRASSWGLGKYVLINPNANEQCVADLVAEKQEAVVSVKVGGNLDSCPNIMNVADWSANYAAQEGRITRPEFARKTVTGYDDGSQTETIYVPLEGSENIDRDEAGNPIPYSYTGYLSVNTEAKTYDSHYLLGNYYTLAGATAGTSGTYGNDYGSLESSICPKGWRLPMIAVNENSTTFKKSYNSLLQTYINDKAMVTADYDAAKAPLYFVRSGSLGYAGEIRYLGKGASYRSATTFGSYYLADSRFLQIAGDSIAVKEGWGRPNGYVVRCVAR